MWRDNGKLSWRKLWSFVSQLPPESATATALRVEAGKNPMPPNATPHDVETEQWSRVEQLLAAVRDELHYFRYTYTAAHQPKGRKVKWTPEPLPRPGVKSSKKKREILTTPQVDTLWAHLQRTQGTDLD